MSEQKWQNRITGYRLYEVEAHQISATDLKNEIQLYIPSSVPYECYRIEVLQGDDKQSAPEMAQVLYLPIGQRLGIAWGADATWATVDSLMDGIAMWLYTPEEWKAAN